MLPDWLQPTFALLPINLWFFFGVGTAWALAILPRSDWRKPFVVIVCALMLGATFNTTAMFLIGTFGKWTLENVLLASVVLAGVGVFAVFRRAGGYTASTPNPPLPNTASAASNASKLSQIEIILIILLVISILIRFVNTAYWPYANYDELWVFGYNAKIFMLTRSIPTTMGYYPQLVALAQTFPQLAWGSANEHAARTVVPFFGLASVLMVYVFAGKLFGRKVGLVAAAIWSFYPHFSSWTSYGDLEVPLTFLFTGAATFFIFAWRERSRRYAVMGGLFAAAALWTKPTAGALIESLALIAAIVVIQTIAGGYIVRLTRRAVGNFYFPRWSGDDPSAPPFEHDQGFVWEVRRIWRAVLDTPLLVYGLTLLPIGGMWYIRNILFGLPPLVFPGSYWLDEAQRSGQELGWPLVLIGLLVILLIQKGYRARDLLLGYALILTPALFSAFDQPHPHRLNLLEYAVMGVGLMLLLRQALRWWGERAPLTRRTGYLIAAFILPYFGTWFWSYSYHFRLSFAIVPLFIVPIAALADRIVIPQFAPLAIRRTLATVALIVCALPAYKESLGLLEPLLNHSLPDDHAKQAAANPALMTLVDFLQAKKDTLNRPLYVVAPEELRLPFFFPFDNIRVKEFPTRLDEIANVDYFVDSAVGQKLYRINGKADYNQILASFTRENVMRRVMTVDDRENRFSVYTIDNALRYQVPPEGLPIGVQVGDFTTLVKYELTRNSIGAGARVFFTLHWKAIKPAPIDYSVFIHIYDPQTNKAVAVYGGEPVSGVFNVWQGVPGAHFSLSYHTRLWQAGEYVRDEWVLNIPKDAPPGKYELRVGLFDALKNDRLPITRDGVPLGDSYKITDFTIEPGS
jgi:hypothetical protein